MTRRYCLWLLGLAVAGCPASDGPIDPVWAKQPCAECKMLVSDKRFAAQALEPDGTRVYFDDVGCMILHFRHQQPQALWARDGVSGNWVEARQARYRRGAQTPMNYGFEVVAAGEVDFDEVKSDILSRRP